MISLLHVSKLYLFFNRYDVSTRSCKFDRDACIECIFCVCVCVCAWVHAYKCVFLIYTLQTTELSCHPS